MATTRPDTSRSPWNRKSATPLAIALSAFDIATLIATIGMLGCRLAVLPRDADDVLARNLHRALCVALALLTLASFGILLSRTLELNGGDWDALFPDLRLALAVTHFGHVWWWRVPALAVAWIAWAWRRRDPWTAWATAIAVAAIALTRSETGHPADHGDFTLAVWIDWLHLLAAGAWVGSLFGMSLVVFPGLLRAGERAFGVGAMVFQRLSTLSGAALAVLLAAGIFNVATQLGSADALWRTRYGAALDVKLAIVLAMIALGAHNRYAKLPRLRACAGLPVRRSPMMRWLPGHAWVPGRRTAADILRSCARAVLVESLLGLAVIGATGVLLHAMPPADAPAAHPMQASMSKQAPGPPRFVALRGAR